jgi:Leucine-rich repeat (LRR) protein
MKYFGVLSLLVVIVVGVVVSTSGLRGGSNSPDGEQTQSNYQDAIDSAQEAADSISEAGTVKIEIYPGISFAPNVVQVEIPGQNLDGSLKAEIRKLSDVRMLDISNNSFTGLPAEIGQLSKLRTLNVSNNALTGLPREIGQLQNLELLDVSGNNYSEEDLAAIEAQLPATTQIIKN